MQSPPSPSLPAYRLKRRRVRLRGEPRAVRDRRRGRMIAAVMLVVALVYGGLVVWKHQRVMRDQGSLAMGAAARDVRYQLGEPTRQAGSVWTYVRAGHAQMLFFDAAGRLDRASCTARIDADQPCPSVFSVGIASEESEMRDSLGRPDREVLVGEDKVAVYAGLGYAFRLHRGAVVRIDHQLAVPSAAFWRQLLWALIP